jgi:ABC-type Zn uptake system ZnuABC Zn-binding protein ZnuA
VPWNSSTMRGMRGVRVIVTLCVWLPAWVAPAGATISVVATIFPLTDMVRQVGKDEVAVATLLPGGANPHTFEPTPAQVRAVANARVFVCVGAGLDSWATKLLAARSGPIIVVTVTDGLPLLGTQHGHDADGGDPHVWVDPVLMRDHAVPAITAALSQADPEHRAAFEAAAAAFQSALSQLDVDIRTTLSPLPNRNYVAFHSAWRYFARRYDLHEIGVVEAFPGKEPSAREIAAVVEGARAARVHALVVEPQYNARTAQQIAAEFDGRTVLVDAIGGPDVAGRNHYIDLMRYNLRAFVEALS